MSDQVVVRVVCKMLFPFIIMYALYTVLHGELGPGGGFQGGVILGAAFVFYGMVFGATELEKLVPPRITDVLMAVGVLVYAGTALQGMLAGGNFLDYAMLDPEHGADGEALGVTLVEYGVGITVSSVMVTIYTQITQLRRDGDVVEDPR
jgi:multicomponent Na+:H+ antiporter subunit B